MVGFSFLPEEDAAAEEDAAEPEEEAADTRFTSTFRFLEELLDELLDAAAAAFRFRRARLKGGDGGEVGEMAEWS